MRETHILPKQTPEIKPARFAEAFLLRYAADTALEMQYRRRALRGLVQQYTSGDGLARLAAYLAIQEQGDKQTIRRLREVPTGQPGLCVPLTA